MASKSKQSYYAVAIGDVKEPTIFKKWKDCEKAVKGVKGSRFKKFDTLAAAEKYIIGIAGNVEMIVEEQNGSRKICPICERPHKRTGQCCAACTKNRMVYDVSIIKMVGLVKENPGCDIWEILKTNKNLIYKPLLGSKKKEIKDFKRDIKAEHRSDQYQSHKYDKLEKPPLYILNAMKKYPSRKLIGLTGYRTNPMIHYECLKCNEDQVAPFNKMHIAHDCSGTKSSGQVIVEEFLKGRFDYIIERATLKCISPVTKRQLPYDIEITGKNVLIEIQGHQHLKFVPHFHGSEENFAYQQRKDSYKKRWAEHKGYKVLYIYYEDFKDDQYKEKILNFIGL